MRPVYLAISFFSLFAVAGLGLAAPAQGQGYTLNEEEAEELVDEIKDEAIPLVKDSVSLAHSLITRLVNIFIKGNFDFPEEYTRAGIIASTIVAVIAFWFKMATIIQKVALVLVIVAIVAFMLYPTVETQPV